MKLKLIIFYCFALTTYVSKAQIYPDSILIEVINFQLKNIDSYLS